MTPSLHLEEGDRGGNAHGECDENADHDPRLLARCTGTADPELVVMPEVTGVDQVAPRGEHGAGDQGMVGEQVQRPTDAVERSIQDDHEADQRDHRRTYGQTPALRLPQQVKAATEDGEPSDAEHERAHQACSGNEPSVGAPLYRSALLFVL